MKLRLPAIVIFYIFQFSMGAQAQENPAITFNKVKVEDFSIKEYTVDTTLGAVIVAEIGKSYFEGNTNGWFSLVHKVKRRVKVIDKKGFDLATVRINLYKSKEDKAEVLEEVKATTYNIENGRVIETKLNKDDIFKEQVDENHIAKKFTMPSVKEGSLIEYSYTIKSDFLFNLQPWYFQGSYPIIWSEYEVAIPEFFDYVTVTQGYLPFDVKTNTISRAQYSVADPSNDRNYGANTKTKMFMISADKGVSRWVIKNAPALKEEKFTSSLANHISGLEFQLAGHNFPESGYKPVMATWKSATEDLLAHKDFGLELSNVNKMISKEMGFSGTADVTVAEAKRIYKYIQANIRNKGERGIFVSQPLKETFKNKSGYVSDINLLLTMVLISQGFEAAPVLLSTRSNGVALKSYPIIQKFNYVLCKVIIDDKNYYLDASQAYLGFNKLPAYCYNGDARTVNKTFDAEFFSADSVTEYKSTAVTLMLDNDKPENWLGNVQAKPGYYESSSIREEVAENGKDAFIKKISEAAKDNFKISDIKLVRLDTPEEDLMINYNIDIENNNSNIIYFSPVIHAGMLQNPFKSEDRKYPVEMNYKINEVYSLQLAVPAGYAIDELPKSERVIFNQNEGMFEYLVSTSVNQIRIKTVVKLDKATFTNEDYDTLRKFFNHIVNKQAEQIVFKKK